MCKDFNLASPLFQKKRERKEKDLSTSDHKDETFQDVGMACQERERERERERECVCVCKRDHIQASVSRLPSCVLNDVIIPASFPA